MMTLPARRSPRDWLVDALLFVLAITFALISLVDGFDRNLPAGPLAVDLVLGGLCCLGVWVRRRWPVGFAVIAGLCGIYSTAAAGAALIALFTVAVHRRITVAAPIVAGFVLASLLIRPDPSIPRWGQILLGIACLAAVLSWGMFLRARRQLVESLRERARRAESEQELRVAQARHLERHRIAREMHDVLAHRISLLSLHAGALELRPNAPPEDIARAAGVIRDSAHQVLEDLREVIGVLRAGTSDDDAPYAPQPTLVDLSGLVSESQRAGVRVILDCQADLATVPEVLGRNAYRIVQEGLTNARKHAPGTQIMVIVQGKAGEGLLIEVTNPLPANAFEVTAIPGTGTGLVGLAERANLAGGRLEHGGTADGNFRLWAWLPWPK